VLMYMSPQCWYGSTLSSKSTKVVDSSCNMKCRGSSSQTCGGSNRLTLFKLSSAPTSGSTSTKLTTSTRPTTSTATKTTVVPTTTAKTTSAVAAPTSPASSSKKRGIGYNDASLLAPFGNGISWAYNWGDHNFGSTPAGVEILPMLWKANVNDPAGLATWKANAAAAIANGATALMGYNEPDLAGQANMDPKTAAVLWKTYMEPFAGQVKLISPAVTNGNGMDSTGRFYGLDWLLQFKSYCTGCTIHAYALHWYETATNTGYFENHFTNATKVLNGNIWPTEFYPTTGDDAGKAAFFNTVGKWLESQSFVERYAAFGAFNSGFGQLISGTQLNAPGAAYVSPK